MCMTCLLTATATAQTTSYPLSATELARRISAKEQITDVPTIYIDIPSITTEAELDAQLYKIRKNNADDEEVAPYLAATITVVDNSPTTSQQHLESFTDEVEIKVRGNSTASAGNNKRPYRLKFASKSTAPDGVAHKHDLLGKGYAKRNWTLLANAFDRSMLRNAVTYHIGQYVGMPFCPGYKYVDLVISGLYRGTYMVSDHCEVGSHRIDIDEDNDWYMEFSVWGSMADAPYVGQGDNDDHFVSIKNPDAEDLTEDQITQLKADVKAWRKDWISAFSNSGKDGWQAYNDVETFIKFFIAIELTGDLDGYFVFKGYRQPDGPFFWGPLWDKDLAFGNSSYAKENTMVENYNKTNFEYIFKNSLFKDKTFLTLAKAKIDELAEAGLADNLKSDIDDIVATINNTRLQNYEKWNISEGSMGSEVFLYPNYADHVTQLKGYIDDRIPFIQEQLQALIDALPPPVEGTYDPTKYNYQDSHGLILGTNYNMSVVNRTLQGGQWNAFSLPFDATAAQVEAAFGCSYEVRVHSGMASDGVTMEFSAPATKDLMAGVPYLIKPASNVNTFGKFNEVVFSYDTHWGSFNGNEVTFDDVHIFKASLFTKNIPISGNYIFNNDIYTDDNSLVALPKAEEWSTTADYPGARAFITTTDGSTPKIVFVEGGVEPIERIQLTDLPTIYIDTAEGAEIEPSSGAWTQAAIEVIDANGTLTPFVEESANMKIRGRGTTTWTGTDKKSYRIQFAKDVKDDLGNVTASYKHYLLGPETNAVVKKRNWVLMANAGDKSLVRNALTKHLGDALGMPFTPGYCFIDLVVNGTYVGTYQVTEYLEADANRVDVDEDTGYFVEMTGADEVDPTDHVISGDDNTPYVTIKNPSVKSAAREAFNTTFKAFFDPMWAATDGTGIDKTSFVNWYIATEILGRYDGLSDIFAFKEADDEQLCFGPLWNNDAAYNNAASFDMSNTGLMSDYDTEGSCEGLLVNAGKNSAWKTKIQQLWNEPWFASAVIDRWEEIYGTDDNLEETLLDALTTLATTVDESQALNYSSTDGGAGWTLSGQGVTGVSANTSFTTYAAAVGQVQTYLQQRFSYLDRKLREMAVYEVAYDVSSSDAVTDNEKYNQLTADVTLLNRKSIYGGEWNAICLPFSANEQQLLEVFGEGVSIETFQSVNDLSQDGMTHVELSFAAPSEMAVVAGKPYLVMPVADVSDLTFHKVTFDCSQAMTDEIDGWQFAGTLQPVVLPADGKHLALMRDNVLKMVGKASTLHGGRAYVVMPETAAGTMSIGISMEEATDGIRPVFIGDQIIGQADIYHVNGQYMGRSFERLPKGVYVVNGKRIIK